MFGTILRIDRRIEREIDAGLRAGLGDLLPHAIAIADKEVGVTGHVDDGGDAAGSRRARRPDEILLILLRARMHLRIDRARQHIGVAEIVALLRLRATPSPTRATLPSRIATMAVVDDAICGDDAAGDDEIEITHGYTRSCNSMRADEHVEQTVIGLGLRGACRKKRASPRS